MPFFFKVKNFTYITSTIILVYSLLTCGSKSAYISLCVCVCVCVSVREKEREIIEQILVSASHTTQHAGNILTGGTSKINTVPSSRT